MGLARVLGIATVALTAPAVVTLACGDRTALLPDAYPDAARAAHDAGVDTFVGMDAPPDVAVDVPLDASFDAPEERTVPTGCPDAAATLVYVVTEGDQLYSFDPPSRTFTSIGHVDCPGSSGSAWSMAVDRAGTAYVLYRGKNVGEGGPLYRVDTATAACKRLPYKPDQDGLFYFGMGFATNGTGPTETLYLQGDVYILEAGSSSLASLDTATWKVTPIGGADPPLSGGELTGTGAGELFAFFKYDSDPHVAHLGKLDKTTGTLVSSVTLPGVDISNASFAVAFWGGAFYLFTNASVARYSPMTGATELGYATLASGDLIVGAGVSTCAPP